MENSTNPMQFFEKEAPAVFNAFNTLVTALKNTDGLDEKTKHLLYIAVKAAAGDKTAVYYHVPMAKKLGATRNQVKDAILITLTVCGLQGVTGCLQPAMEVYDNTTP